MSEEVRITAPEISGRGVGRGKAARASTRLESVGFQVITSDHPSQLVKASFLETWHRIPKQWSEAVDGSSNC